MNTYFYLYGIIYILHHIKSLYDVISFNYKKDVQDKISELMPDKVTEENVIAFKNTAIDIFKKGAGEMIATFIAGILNLVWIIYGALYAVESNSFSILIIITALSSLIAIGYSVNMMLKNKKKFLNTSSENPKAGILSLTDKVPKTKLWNVIDHLALILIAGFILYSHFFIVV